MRSETTEKTEKVKSCPKCKSTDVERIPRSQLLKVLAPWMPLKHYICYRCSNKFYLKSEGEH